jgi:mannan endo-1,4-beta-mannosidase
MNVRMPADAPPEVLLTLTVPDAPAAGFTVTGAGFAPDSWIWITIDDITADTQPINGPDAFQPDPDGTFTRTDPTMLTCGHTLRANAFVLDAIVATSATVTPQCPPKPPMAADTADVDATAATKLVYADLVTAPARADHRLVIGQALRGWDFKLPIAEPVTALTNAGLPAPKLLEVDLTDFGGPPAHDAELRTLLLDHAALGGLVGFSFHVNNPFNGLGVDNRADVDLPQLFDPANPLTPAGIRWKAELDGIADIMRHFADAVVLFRPFHESNLEFFWWGRRNPVDFRNAWQGMFRYLTTTRGLHNLLWVYCASRNHGEALSDPTLLYPGDAFVDLVGLDIYDDNLSDAEPAKPGYAAMVALNKPFGITEYGADNVDPPHNGYLHLPNDRVRQLIKERYPHTVLATAWYSRKDLKNNWQISDKPHPEALLLDPWAITL